VKTIEFLSHLRQLGIELRVDDDRLRLSSPKGMMTPELKAEITTRKGEILTFLKAAKTTNAPGSLKPAPRQGTLPLAYSQQRVWFLEQFEADTTAYNMFTAVRLRGPLQIVPLEQSINTIIQRHESLRTTFSVTEGQPFQIIHPYQPWMLSVVDLSHLTGSRQEAEVQVRIQQESQKPFDLTRESLFRAQLLKLSDVEHVFVMSMHHIISDAWSFGIFARELALLYSAFIKNEDPSLPELAIQYADYAIWQQKWLRSEVEDTQLAYWKEQLAGELPTLELPTDYLRPPIQTLRGASQVRLLSPELSRALNHFCQQEDVTLFMMLLTGFKLLLYRYTRQDDIIVGSPIAGRNRKELEGLIGFFINSIVLRTRVSGSLTFHKLLGQVREVALNAYTNQDVPFEMLLDVLKPERDLSRTPLFQVFFNMLNSFHEWAELPGITEEVISHPAVESKFDLTLYISESADQIRLNLVYNADLFSTARMDEMLCQFEAILSQAVVNPHQTINNFLLVTEQAQVPLPDPTQPLDSTWCGPIHTSLTHHAQHQPDRLAVSDPKDQWSYQELEARCNQLAHYLIQQGVESQAVVMIYGHRSASLVWAIMGILKSGAAYVILDPAYPTARLLEYVSQAQPFGWIEIEAAGPPPAEIIALLETLSCNCRLKLPARSVAVREKVLAEYPVTSPNIEVEPDDLAYLSFTSGSTGIPKAVLGRHGPLSHFLPWQETRFELDAGDNFSMLSGLAHDPLQRDIFTALWAGGTICIPDPQQMFQPGWLAQWLREETVTISHLTPAMGKIITIVTETAQDKLLATHEITSLRYAFFVGDILTRRDVERLCNLAPNVQVINFYGSTETQRAVSFFVVDGGPEKSEPTAVSTSARPKEIIPLGQGIPDTQLLILNAQDQLAGIGEVGEICMRSPHLAKGYLDDDRQTAQKFMTNPFTNDPADRCYCTGDLGRYLPDGNAEFTGRIDEEVKIRGFRIEPGEIEAVLGRYPAIRDSVVIAREDTTGDKRLIAYVVPNPDEPGPKNSNHHRKFLPKMQKAQGVEPNQRSLPLADKLRDYIRQYLPDHMIPSAFVCLEKLPLTPNGKIDHRALPVPDQINSTIESGYVAPHDEVERQLVEIWEELMDSCPISIWSDFFDLGGHSLLAIRLFNRIEEIFGQKLPLATLFQSPTIAQLADVIRQEGKVVDWSPLVEIQRGNDSRTPLFCVHGWGGGVVGYADLAQLLGPEQPFYGLRARGLNGQEEPHTEIAEMANDYLKAVRQVQKTGPYYLGGYCQGGVIAFEMAQQLQAAGEQVALLALFDSYAPIERSMWDVIRTPRNFANFARNSFYWLADFRQLGYTGMLARLRRKINIVWSYWLRPVDTSKPIALEHLLDDTSQVPYDQRQLMEIHTRLRIDYVPQPYRGRVTLFRVRSLSLFRSQDPDMGWGKLATGGVESRIIAGAHRNILEKPQVQTLAEQLKSVLERSQYRNRDRHGQNVKTDAAHVVRVDGGSSRGTDGELGTDQSTAT
jgi:amino acid adenylation domain-containing protein